MISLEKRFLKHVNKNGPLPEFKPELGRCWIWIGSKNHAGYGHFTIMCGKTKTLNSTYRPFRAHRVSWELYRSKIPSGLTVDHLCRTPACVNPDHLEVVTMKVNVLRGFGPTAMQARQTYCKRKHPLSGDNLYLKKGQGGMERHCRECERRRHRAWYRRKLKSHPNHFRDYQRARKKA